MATCPAVRGPRAELEAGFHAVEGMMVYVLPGPGWAPSGPLLPFTAIKEAQGHL